MGAAAGPDIVEDGLVLCLDAANERSYSGSGTILNNISKTQKNGKIVGATYNNTSKHFEFSDGDRIGFGIHGGESLSYNPGSQNQITSCAWIYPMQGSSGRAPITRIDRWYFQVYSLDRLATYWYGRSPAGYHYSNANIIPLNKWSHVCVVWSSSNIKFFVNGKKDKTINGVGGTGNTNNWISVGYENSSREYVGKISLVNVYNRALTDAEIKQNFEATRSRYGI